MNDTHPLQRGTLLYDIFNNPKAFDSKYSSPIHVNNVNKECNSSEEDSDEEFFRDSSSDEF